MKNASAIILTSILLFSFSQRTWPQEGKELEEFLKQNPTEYQKFQTIQQSFKNNRDLSLLIHDLIMWHTDIVQSKLMPPAKELFQALKSSPGNFSEKREYTNAKNKFLEICKTSFKKDDEFRKELEEEELATWAFWAAVILSYDNASFVMYKQDKQKSYSIGTAILTYYTSTLLNVVYDNKRDTAAISEMFLRQTEKLVQWVDKIPLEARK